MPPLPPAELARRALPWVLMGKFKNVVREVQSGRVIEVWTSRYAGVFVPAAAKFLYVPRPVGREKLYEAEVDTRRGRVTFRYGAAARVEGYLPFTGERRVIKAETVFRGEPVVQARLVGGGEPSPVSVDIMARDILRVNAAPIFGGHVLNVLVKKLGVNVASGPRVALKPVELREGNIEYDFGVPLRIHYLRLSDGRVVQVPSVVAGAVALIGRGEAPPLLDEKGMEKLEEFLKRVYEQGNRVYPVSSAVLQSTRRASWTYIIGRVTKPPADWVLLGRATGRGALLKVYATPKGDLVARISILPFNPPAVIVLNYPPFTAAPLVATLHERSFTEAIEKAVAEKGREYGAEHWLDEYKVLTDARVYISTIRGVLTEGYPRLSTLEDVMDRLEPLGRIGDVMRMAIAPADVKEKLLVEELKPVERREERRARIEEGEEAAEVL